MIGTALYSQHIKGKHNFIADSLSRDYHMTNDQLTYAFKTLLPLQTPSSFRILPLPREVDSVISSLNRRLIMTQESHHHPTRSKLGVLINGADSWETLVSTMSGCLNILGNKKTYLLSAFASACRRNRYGKKRNSNLRGNTIKSTVSNVRATFRKNLRADPGLDVEGKFSIFLTRKLSGYVDADSFVEQEKALPLRVFKELLGKKFTPLDEAMGQLATGAFFFGMRSCEYLIVSGTRKTKQLMVNDIRFFKNSTELKDKTNELILFADTVTVTFVFQKNKKKMVCVTQPHSGKKICPVVIWAKIILRILKYKGTSEKTKINVVKIGDLLYHIKR